MMPTEPTTPYGRWTVAWAGLAGLATVNGLSRGLYARRLGDHRAHQVSTATLVAVVLPYARAVERRWPIPGSGGATAIGASWLAMTVAFESGLGRYVAGQSGRALLQDYDLRRGRMWPVALAAVAAAPAAARRARLHREPTERRRPLAGPPERNEATPRSGP
jgi:hypothetical protein